MVLNKMRGFVLLVCMLFVITQTVAQSYTGGGMPIPDHGAAINIPLNVSGLDSAQINTNYGLERVCININHTADQDLAIYLMSPDGTSVELTSGLGGTGDNYSNTCFDMSATTLITLGTPPFTGSYVPRHSIGIVNNGSNGNGTWRLVLIDYIAGDTGSVLDWSLEFGYSPPPPVSISIGACDDYHPAACLCPDSARSCWLKPDMFVASSMLADTLIWQHESFGRLQVTNSCANIGFGPMELIGTGLWYCGDSLMSGPGLCPDSTYRKQLVKQRVYIKRDGLSYFDHEDVVVGMMQFHSALGHNHLHIDDWARNSIRLRGPETDPSKWPTIATGLKVSFCLYDHLACGSSFRNCQYDTSLYLYAGIPNNGLGAGYSTCGASVQGISVGYSDVYDWMLEGQDIYFDSLCNGNYYLVCEFDPSHRFIDNDSSNNITAVPLHLRQQLVNCCKTNFRIDTLSYGLNWYRFVDMSVPIPDHWLWDFGNGSFDSTQFPIVDFDDTVNLNIKLKTWIDSGCNDSMELSINTHIDYNDTCHFRIFTVPVDFWQAEIVVLDSGIISHFSIDFPTATIIDTLSPFRFKVYDPSCAFCFDTAILHATDTIGCSKTIVFTYQVAWEGIEEIATVDNIKIYPNPAFQQSELSFNIHRNSDVSINLFDCLGRNIQSVNSVKKHIVGEYHYHIDLPAKGVYFLRCKFDNTEQTFKLISY